MSQAFSRFQVSSFRFQVPGFKFSVNMKHGTWNLKRVRGQASLEMTVALIGAMLLMLGSFKVWLWVNQRLVQRQQDYEASRVTANNGNSMTNADSIRLNIFK